ncbi:YehS family protein [Bowmanella dokdonensis]|uniref:DUF1456 family protein n=1 Tax=Bowmanella dokdonensis TaxID=751969 RepID=A0A939IMD3_9ALTE|nr:DUF1456 family protein [Bowmanella dokdonensis]MBN7825193.1 DUF1456 family protein [Bowmanella dokdonensis]
MLLNDVLRRLRFALSLDNSATIQIFKLVDYDMEEDYLMSMMRREEEQGFIPCRDKILGLFLDGLIIKKRGRLEGAPPQPLKPGERLSNNDILRKIKIAMNYQQDEMLTILRTAGFPIGKSELTALFRKPDHRSYRPCGDQLLRNFLQGMVKTYRPDVHQKQ